MDTQLQNQDIMSLSRTLFFFENACGSWFWFGLCLKSASHGDCVNVTNELSSEIFH